MELTTGEAWATQRSRRRRRWIGVAALLAVAIVSAHGQAEPLPNLLPKHRQPPPPPKRDQRFSGAYVGLEALSGLAIIGNSQFTHRVGYLVGVRGRVSTLMQIAAIDLAYVHSGYRLSYQQHSYKMFRHSIGGSLYLHPLFIFLLQRTWFSTVLASMYLNVGLQLEVATLRSSGLAVKDTRLDWSWGFGCGVDIPLNAIDRGASWWLGAAYRHNRLFINTGIPTVRNLSDHWLMLTVSYRINGL